ncbi:SET domain-containing protein, putative [Candida dubliniensis CD36]|uniref:Histone-lysine N-methyltransferase, H3 lysine-36 specific n=1 Tax=Candida dubliniensis (strain CD36 / ATCC MYA-646 / CBS 7987 / NCPF 3949 / NRRL Y-17841) TaxID=573826 RepID=B9WCT7_CANDC|nr:SET domain-containing protein, putative [Candida dubliniensis CD36]CAX44211.1 SET domain-containing protein, putative [Candida dubliniensis CD36]
MSNNNPQESSNNSNSPLKRSTPMLFLDAEDKTQEALTTFELLNACTYQNKYVGSANVTTTTTNKTSGSTSTKSHQQQQQNRRKLEFMTCDCEEEWDSELQMNLACGPDSNCINRITCVECINKNCLCGDDCQNQRFQNCQYSKVKVIQTELKGYGLIAEQDIEENQFIYEYIGEVIDESSFRQRMIEYDLRHLKHFYFMMLSNDSFIDATQKGSLGRFINHSCNPNAFVDKWHVGDRLRMGIFAKRKILRGEEITFDYNVDRYGAQSQPCYCGEPNCIKFMGGKTQTDAALLLPQMIAEALGVTPRQEKAWLKENKSIRNQQQNDESNINEEFVNSIEIDPIENQDGVTKVMSALMKTQHPLIIKKLIERISVSSGHDAINVMFVRFHGYKTISTILQDLLVSKNNDKESETNDHDNNKDSIEDKDELIIKILKILVTWPAVTKNKISSSNLEEVVKDIQTSNESSNNKEEINELCTSLLERWSKLEMAYRIPKQESAIANNATAGTATTTATGTSASPFERISSHTPELGATNTPTSSSQQQQQSRDAGLPENWRSAFDKNTGGYYYYNTVTQETTWERPLGSLPLGPKPPSGPGIKGRLNKYNEIDLAKREELRIQKEKEMKFIEMQNRDRKLKELIEMSKKSMNNSANNFNGFSDNGDNNGNTNTTSTTGGVYGITSDKQGGKHHHDKHSKNGPRNTSISTSTSDSGSGNIEKTWKRIFAKYIPNIIKKYESEIGRDNVKGCARELVNVLTQSEIKHGKKPPSNDSNMELNDKKLKKIKEYSYRYMDKFLIKFNNSKKNKSITGSNGGDSDKHKRKHDDDDGNDGENGVKRSKV